MVQVIVGTSLAYHLAKFGITDVVLLERKQLTCGTTWHAAGLVGQLRATRNLTELAKYTTSLFETLEAETVAAVGKAYSTHSIVPFVGHQSKYADGSFDAEGSSPSWTPHGFLRPEVVTALSMLSVG